ncbi:hypothetical protein PPERSA_11652 [Pseudocohnilembus persalinus]|uniref:Uncharacterized protein n=1 Tax=Pseudocohnilembus persalinus TaxID=266149 RepID=A0A0V0QA59_PSEPJ|nr:hypothetical protein PPERSA_11652 [Pseudocohnilembus persalinus]|eukprot:KRW99051.1 hypothetical protein PPERSA_11652 [Pseudocohnilembus persalinus]
MSQRRNSDTQSQQSNSQYHSFKQKSSFNPYLVQPKNAIYNPLRKNTELENKIYETTKTYVTQEKANIQQRVNFLKSSKIFDFTSKPPEQPNRNQEFKPAKNHQFRHHGQQTKQNLNYKRQLHTVDHGKNASAYTRNPIVEGDPKSEYVKNLRVNKNIIPKDQFIV